MRIGNYEITTDPYNWILSEVKVWGEESKNCGEERKIVLGYYNSLDALTRAITDDKLKKDWETIQDFKTDVEHSLKELIDNESDR